MNKPESASSLLDKAGKMIEKERPGDATGLYEKAAVTVSTEDRSERWIGDFDISKTLTSSDPMWLRSLWARRPDCT